MQPIITHDIFFRSVFSHPAFAADLIRGFLPASIVRNIDFSSLRRLSDSFVSSRLTKRIADVILAGKSISGKPVQILFLLEHKSQLTRRIEIQLLVYIAELWREYSKARKPVPLVLPVVFYHGKKAWKTGQVWDHFPDSLMPYVPAFKYILIDLAKTTNREIAGSPHIQHASAKLALLAQKNIFTENDLRAAADDMAAIAASSELNDTDRETINAIVIYLLSRSAMPEKEIAGIFSEQSTEDLTMTTAMRILQRGEKRGLRKGEKRGMEKGIQKGIKQGMEKGSRETMNNIISTMLAQGLGVSNISRLTGLSIDEVRKLSEKQ